MVMAGPYRTASLAARHCSQVYAGCACYGRAPEDDDEENASHRVPREHVAGALERRERRSERAFELSLEPLRRPAVGAMQRADRPVLVEQIDLVIAHRENLPGDALGAIGGEINR